MRFPINETSPVEHGGELPEAADTVVIGGGVIGVCTALYLARAGQRVVLLEKGRIAGEQSSRNWGWIRQQGRDPAELPIMIEANRLWHALARDTNEDIGLRQTGVMYLADTAKAMAGYENWLTHARAHDLDSRLLSSAEVAAKLPQAAKTWAGGLWTASDMRAEPFVAVPALARAAAREGAVIVENCAVRLIDMAAGQVAGVVTERGRIRAGTVVLAGGAWSSLLLRRHGVALPQLSVRSTVAMTAPMPEVFDGAGSDRSVSFRRRADGGYTIAGGGTHGFFIGPDAFRALLKFIPQLRADPFGTRFHLAAPAGFPDAWRQKRRWQGDESSPFEATRILDPAPDRKRVAALAAAFGGIFPQAGPVKVTASWAGMIDTMPDIVPVVDHVPAMPGLIVATGMSGHGFGIGPGFGRILADMVQGRAPGHDMTRFRFGRFSDGAPVTLGPSL